MSAAPSSTAINCTQCGGELSPDQGQVFLTCRFCSSTVYLDKKQVVFHHYLAPTLDEAAAKAHLRAWMSGNDTVKDLDVKSSLGEVRFEYFPVWFFRIKTKNEQEQLVIEPAAATAVLEMKKIRITAGDLRRFDPSTVTNAIDPSVPLDVAREWMARKKPDVARILESALVHLPFYRIEYQYKRRVFSAIVEAGTGQVLVNFFPAKKEMPYRAISLLSIGGYFILSLLPVFSAFAADDAFLGFMSGVVQYFILGTVFFVFCMIMAIFVAKKV